MNKYINRICPEMGCGDVIFDKLTINNPLSIVLFKECKCDNLLNFKIIPYYKDTYKYTWYGKKVKVNNNDLNNYILCNFKDFNKKFKFIIGTYNKKCFFKDHKNVFYSINSSENSVLIFSRISIAFDNEIMTIYFNKYSEAKEFYRILTCQLKENNSIELDWDFIKNISKNLFIND